MADEEKDYTRPIKKAGNNAERNLEYAEHVNITNQEKKKPKEK